MANVYIGLGFNLGDRVENLRRALTLMKPEIRLERASRVYESTPMYKEA